MPTLKLAVISPCVDYLDEASAGDSLAPRAGTLAGKVVGLVPNWRPAAIHLLTAVGALLRERHGVKDVILDPPVRVSAMAGGGKLLDGVRAQLDALARRVDVAVTATGD